MSDFDERLSAVLTSEAEASPHVAGLAQAARRRHAVRRRRQLAVGAVAVVLAIAAPVAVLASAGGGGNGDELVGNDETSTAPAGEWQTIEQEDVRVEVPGDWRRFTCEFEGTDGFDVFGPSEEDACDDGIGLRVFGSATFDPFDGPGVLTEGTELGVPGWSGYVYAGDWAVYSTTPELDLTRRILASARVEGQPEVDASQWLTVDGVGIEVDMPLLWGLGPDADLANYAVCVLSGGQGERPDVERKPGAEATYVALEYRDGRWISVAAPTQAVGDLVMATVQGTPGNSGIGCVPDDLGDGVSGAEQAFPCDPGFGAPKPRAGCPDPNPDVGWLSRDSGGEFVLQPFRTLRNDAEGEAYAQENGLEYPFSNDYLDVTVGEPRALDPMAAQFCTGAIQVGHREPLEDHAVDCADFGEALERRDARIPVAVWWDGGVVVQLSELYRP